MIGTWGKGKGIWAPTFLEGVHAPERDEAVKTILSHCFQQQSCTVGFFSQRHMDSFTQRSAGDFIQLFKTRCPTPVQQKHKAGVPCGKPSVCWGLLYILIHYVSPRGSTANIFSTPGFSLPGPKPSVPPGPGCGQRRWLVISAHLWRALPLLNFHSSGPLCFYNHLLSLKIWRAMTWRSSG